MFAARRSKAGRAAAETGAAVPLAATMLVGSWQFPFNPNSKSKCPPGPQRLALRDRLARAHIYPAQVGVDRDMLVAVLDEDDVAIAVLHAGKRHHAIAHAAHRSAGRGPEIGAPAGAPSLQDRRQAHREAAGRARELHRGAQVGAAHALAVWRVVGALGRPWLLEPDRLVGLAVVDELGAEHPAGAQRLAIGLQRFVDHREAVALAQRAPKVDVARE